jgi:hypothetical protein
MRKVNYLQNPTEEILRLMIYMSEEGVYVFGYDDLADNTSKWDNLFTDIDDALEFCQDNYKTDSGHWISIEEPYINCQHDWIQRVRVKDRESGTPKWGQFEQLINDRWIDISRTENVNSFAGLTGNERLFITGLLTEFENSVKTDKVNAEKILKALQWDEPSLKKILQ